MPKLTDTQLIVLSKAAQRADGAAMLPKGMSKASAAKVAAGLINRKLMRELRAKDGMPVWRTDDVGRSLALIILPAGRNAINVDDGDSEPAQTLAAPQDKKQTELRNKKKGDVPPVAKQSAVKSSPRTGSKQARVIEMLLGTHGATIAEIVAATAWLPHTTRAVLTGLRKRGHVLDRQRNDGVTRYRITSSPEPRKVA